MIDEIDRFIEEMSREAERMVKDIIKQGIKEVTRPHIYGFTIKLGPRGEPIIKSFGDRMAQGGWREPIVDQVVFDEKGEVKLFIELPGIEKKDIKLESTEDQVLLTAVTGDRKYRSTIRLKTPVDPESASATYRNGILEATFKVRGKANKEYREVKVE